MTGNLKRERLLLFVDTNKTSCIQARGLGVLSLTAAFAAVEANLETSPIGIAGTKALGEKKNMYAVRDLRRPSIDATALAAPVNAASLLVIPSDAASTRRRRNPTCLKVSRSPSGPRFLCPSSKATCLG